MNKAQITKNEAINVVKNMPTKSLSKQQVTSLIQSIKSNTNKPVCNAVKVGDVWYNPGLRHPAVVLSISKGIAKSALITTSKPGRKGAHILEKAQSRFYGGCDITNTITSKSVKEVAKYFKGTYDNTKHLREINNKLKKIYG